MEGWKTEFFLFRRQWLVALETGDLDTLRKCHIRKMHLTLYTMNWRKNFKGTKLVKGAYLPNSSCMAPVSAFGSCFQNLVSVEERRWSPIWSLSWLCGKALILQRKEEKPLFTKWLTGGKNLNHN